MEAKGTYDELVNTGKDFAKLLSSSHDENEDLKDVEKPPPMSRRTSARVSTFFQNYINLGIPNYLVNLP